LRIVEGYVFYPSTEDVLGLSMGEMLTVNYGARNVFVTLWIELDYVTNPPLGTLMI
jgi:hypothetical protein